MALRLVRPLYARLDRGTGDADTPLLRAVSNINAGASVLPERKTSADERAQAATPQSAESFDDRSIRVLRGDNTGLDERRDDSFAWPTTTLDDLSTKVQRDDEWRAEERAEAPVPPKEKSSDLVDNSLPADKIVLEELEQQHELRTAAKAHSRRRYLDDDDISTGTIIGIAVGVIVLGLAFTILLPTILTRDPVEPTAALVTSPAPARAVETERTEAAQAAPAPRPAQPPQAAPPPPVPNASTSVAKTAPALRGSSPSEAKTERRAEQVLVPSAGKTATRTALTAAEQAAVTRGLQELEKRPADSAARRPALTAEEQAAVERGLRELEKAAGQAKP